MTLKSSWLRRLSNRLRGSMPRPPIRRHRLKPLLEQLEDRTVPSTIQGIVFHDLDGDGIQGATESGMANVQVFLDSNVNGRLDTGELSRTTDVNGAYSFDNLDPGTYAVALALTADQMQTSPGPATGPGLLGEVTHDVAGPHAEPLGLLWLGDSLYQRNRDNNVIYELNPENGAVRSEFTAPAGDITDLTHDGSHFWASDFGNDRIVRFDSAGTELVSFASPGPSPTGIAWDGSNLWVADNNTDLIYRVDPANGAVLASFPAPADSVVGLTYDGQHLWANGYDSGRIFEIDPSTGEVLRSTFVPGQEPTSARGIAYDGQSFWLSFRYSINTQYSPRIFRVDAGSPASHSVTLGVDETAAANFGIFHLGSVRGAVYDDPDGSGTRDVGEAGLEGWRVFLDRNGNGQFDPWEKDAVTDSNGDYTIGGLRPGSHTVTESLRQPGWTATAGVTRSASVTESGQAVTVPDFGNRLDGVGPVGPETLVNTTTEGPQGVFSSVSGEGQVQAVAVDGTGNYVVVWESASAEDPDGAIFARLFHANGTPRTGEFRVNGVTERLQRGPVAAMDANGNFVVAWSAWDADVAGHAAFARVFNSDGSARTGDLQVTSFSSKSTRIVTSVAMDADGDFAVLMLGSDKQSFFSNGGLISFQRYNAQGQTQGKITQVVDATLINGSASIAMDALGNFVVAWGDTGSDATIFAQRYDSAGKKVGGVLSPGLPGYRPSVAQNAAGAFVLASSGMAQLYSADGLAEGTALTYGPSDQNRPGLAMDGNGNVTFTWAENGDITARRYNAELLEATFSVNTTLVGTQERPSAAMTPAGNFIISWQGNGVGDDSGVFVQRYAAPAKPGITVTPTSGLVTSEDGTTASFSVVLTSKPTHNVIIWLASSNTSEGVVSGGSVLFTDDGRAYLLFTPENWDVAQEVVITGINDDVADGDQAYQIELTADSADPDYDVLAPILVDVLNKDNDATSGGGGNGGSPKK